MSALATPIATAKPKPTQKALAQDFGAARRTEAHGSGNDAGDLGDDAGALGDNTVGSGDNSRRAILDLNR
jgi:hypothetical protein